MASIKVSRKLLPPSNGRIRSLPDNFIRNLQRTAHAFLEVLFEESGVGGSGRGNACGVTTGVVFTSLLVVRCRSLVIMVTANWGLVVVAVMSEGNDLEPITLEVVRGVAFDEAVCERARAMGHGIAFWVTVGGDTATVSTEMMSRRCCTNLSNTSLDNISGSSLGAILLSLLFLYRGHYNRGCKLMLHGKQIYREEVWL